MEKTVRLSEATAVASHEVTILELDKMNRVKAVNKMNACPKGFKKTLWARQVADEAGVSLKTLYVWAKTLENRVVVEHKGGDIDFRVKFSSSAFDAKALEWGLGYMLHHPLTSKLAAYQAVCEQAAKERWKIGAHTKEANDAKTKREETKKAVKKIGMSNDALLEAV